MATNIKQKLLKLLTQLKGADEAVKTLKKCVEKKSIEFPSNERGVDNAVLTVATLFERHSLLRRSDNIPPLSEFYKSIAPKQDNNLEPESEPNSPSEPKWTSPK